MRVSLLAAAIGLLAAPVVAQGDAAAGEKLLKKRCNSCHLVVADNGDGDVLVRGGRTGPNLWGVPGRVAGTYPKYKYGKSIVQAGENGLAWDEATFVEFVSDPKAFLKTYLEDDKAKSKMNLKLKKGGEDIWAYLVSVSPEMVVEEETPVEEAAEEAPKSE